MQVLVNDRWKKTVFYITLAQGLTMTQAHLPVPLSDHQRRLCDSRQACEPVYRTESQEICKWQLLYTSQAFKAKCFLIRYYNWQDELYVVLKIATQDMAVVQWIKVQINSRHARALQNVLVEKLKELFSCIKWLKTSAVNLAAQV